jgi:aspartate aminotransferase
MSESDLEELRKQLRSVDSELVSILARRSSLVTNIGLLKQKLKMGVIDTLAEKSAMENFTSSATNAGLNQSYARRVAELVIEGAADLQKQSRPPTATSDSQLKQFSESILMAEKEGRKLIRLDVGEPRFKTPRAAIREAMRWLTEHPTVLYGSSHGLTELTDAIAERLNKQYGTQLRRSNVLIVPGGRFGFFAAMRTGVASLERVVVCQPAWPAYEAIAGLVGARTRSIPTSFEEGWEIDMAMLEEELKMGAKMLVLNNPCNPTGKALSRGRFEEILRLASKYGTTVLSDEVYSSYCDEPAPCVLQYPDNEAVYLNSFSKEFSMTGWRIAYVVSDEKRIAKIRSLIQTTLTNVPEFIQRAALAALNDKSREAARARHSITKRASMACAELRKAGIEFYPPDAGFYVFPRIRGASADADKFVQYLLSKHGVGVMPGSVFGGYRDFLRLAVTESRTTVQTGIKRIVKAMNECEQQ